MTGTLAETALAFCRECLGYERPVDRKYGEGTPDPFGKPGKAWSDYIFDYHGQHSDFYYTDVGVVLTACITWAKSSRNRLYAMIGLYSAITNWFVPDDSKHDNADLCHVLMAACVEASRKIRSAEPDAERRK